MKWYLAVLKNYAGFSGRARRKEYWMFILFHIIFAIAAIVLDSVLGLNFGDTESGFAGGGYIYIIYTLAIFIPALAVVVRRLHDVGKSGWFYFIVLIPLVGAIWLIVLTCKEGDRGANDYGPDPKGNDEEGAYMTL